MRRIVLILPLLALVAVSWACTADAPTAPNGTNPLQVQVSSANANPAVPTCTPIQAIVTLNGANVATVVTFSTNFGTFGQNGPTMISVTTQSGVANTSLCSTAAGVAVVKASATVGAFTSSSTLNVTFH
jgi:hypothetical protein